MEDNFNTAYLEARQKGMGQLNAVSYARAVVSIIERDRQVLKGIFGDGENES